VYKLLLFACIVIIFLLIPHLMASFHLFRRWRKEYPLYCDDATFAYTSQVYHEKYGPETYAMHFLYSDPETDEVGETTNFSVKKDEMKPTTSMSLLLSNNRKEAIPASTYKRVYIDLLLYAIAFTIDVTAICFLALRVFL